MCFPDVCGPERAASGKRHVVALCRACDGSGGPLDLRNFRDFPDFRARKPCGASDVDAGSVFPDVCSSEGVSARRTREKARCSLTGAPAPAPEPAAVQRCVRATLAGKARSSVTGPSAADMPCSGSGACGLHRFAMCYTSLLLGPNVQMWADYIP